ncbi:inner membrane protein YhjD [Amycolatopsis magusensis]|uniref:inner membrane protein YhjD n=1 Tax=Amycolatopsis magusensis TaxID=882444 RepID=UPI003C30765A
MAKRDAGEKSEEDKLLPRLRRKYPWLDHVVRANEAFTERYGNHYAAAITYFSVLSLFPLLMVGFSIAGMVLQGDQAALDQLKSGITESAPAGLGDFLSTIVETALQAGAGTGIFGLVLALYSGVGWMTNLRDALTAQWGQEKKQQPMLPTLLRDLLSLVGLGLALVVSFGLTAAGSGVGKLLLELVGLQDQAWAVFLLRLATIVLSLAANVLVFLWVIARLPRERVSARSAVKGAVIAAIGFEVLKQVTTVYLGFVSTSPSTVLFGPILGLLFFANLVSRFLLFVTAWTATAKENEAQVVEPPAPVVIRPRMDVRQGPGSKVVAGAFGVGALVGLLTRRKRPRP